MKKFFIIISILAISGLALAGGAYAADTVQVKLFGEGDRGSTYEIDLKETFEDENPEDMYLLLYEKMKYEPVELAVERIMEDKDMTPQERDAVRHASDLKVGDMRYADSRFESFEGKRHEIERKNR